MQSQNVRQGELSNFPETGVHGAGIEPLWEIILPPLPGVNFKGIKTVGYREKQQSLGTY